MAKIATIGFFDGVHRGHRFLFAQLQDRARALNLTPLIYTFDQHPKQVLTGKCPPMLTLLQERQKWLEQYAEVVVLKFTEVQHLTAQKFMSYLHAEQDVDVLLLGYDHRFGSDGLKGFSEYEKMAHRVGIRVLRAHECLVDAVPVSSTRIRKLLAEGQVIQANQLLGYKYALTGEVVHGNGIGKQLGFPTANIQIDALKQLPASGVYMAHTYLENKMYSVLVNIGNNPTVGNTYVSVEAYIVGYHGDLYGHKLTVSLEKFIRPEQKFDSLAELQQQILKDL
jgi:riboflavin kinase/FMN adenylyltransferase